VTSDRRPVACVALLTYGSQPVARGWWRVAGRR